MPAFNYNVTREYPYRWFTPVAIAGGVVLAIMFSAFNFFSTAYIMVPVTTNDPSIIEAGRWPGYVPEIFTRKTQPRCEDAVIPIGSYFYTNQTALSYQLLKARDMDSGRSLPAMAYHNEPIIYCSNMTLLVDFQSVYGRPALFVSWTPWDITVESLIICGIQRPSGTVQITLQAQYNPYWGRLSSVARQPGISNFISENFTSSASLYWAQSLLLAFWTDTSTAMVYETTSQLDVSEKVPRQNLSSGFVRLLGPSSGDIQAPTFFTGVQWRFFDFNKSTHFANDPNVDFGKKIGSGQWPNIWTSVDHLAKAMYTTVNADLGVLGQNHDGENSMISNFDSLRYWTGSLPYIYNATTVAVKEWSANRSPGPQWLDFDTAQRSPDTATKVLDFTNSVIVTTYQCQKPQLKSPANIFISTLIADLVLLRTAWFLYNLVVSYFLKSRHPDANICDDCLARRKEDETLAEQPTTTNTIASTDISEQDIEMNHLAAQRPSAGQHESTQNLLTHRSEEVISLLGTNEDIDHHETDSKNLATTHTSSLGS
ncbi:hypothetical protein D6D04_10260 [Aureobasidium pullulans]|nr:hypothetical protein D6D04_10260 [Aureobasidium pullulans]